MQSNSKLLAASILLLSCCTHPAAHTGDGVVTQPGTRPDATLVEPNKPIERELQENQMHTYAVLVPADQVVSGVIDQRGIDVVMRIIDPTGKLVAVVDKEGSEGPESWTLEPQPAGTWYDPRIRRTASQTALPKRSHAATVVRISQRRCCGRPALRTGDAGPRSPRRVGPR
jgi:hypothetical protein